MVARRLRPLHRGHQADHPARRLGHRGARHRLRGCWSAPAAQLPMVKTMLIPPGLVAPDRDMPQAAPRPVQLLQRVMEPWDGPAAHRRHRLALGRGRPGPQRPAADALRRAPRDGLLIVGSETGMVPLTETDDRREGPRRARARCIAVDLATGTLLPRPRAQGLCWPACKPYAEWIENITHLDERRSSGAPASRRATTGRAAPPADRRRAHRRGPGADPRTRWCEDAKEAVGSMGDDTPLAVLSEQLSRPAPLLPAELQPGHQPADRLACASAGDEPEDAARQPRQHPRRGPEPERDPAARQPGR